MLFALFLIFLLLLRVGELLLSKRNERWLLRHGAVEYAREQYPWIVLLHASFFASLAAEYLLRGDATVQPWLLVLYLCLLAAKGWVIASLGSYWNTRVYRIAHAPLIVRGPYRWLKHPNYLIVIAEIAIIPLAFHLYATAIIFTVLNAIMLTVRIRAEDVVLDAA
jgi:methyltransferase